MVQINATYNLSQSSNFCVKNTRRDSSDTYKREWVILVIE